MKAHQVKLPCKASAESARRRAARRSAAISGPGRRLLALLVLTSLLLGCAAHTGALASTPGQVDVRSARAATAAGKWELAAGHWNTLFMNAEGDPVETCREAARALVELGQLESAKGIVDLGLRRTPGEPELLELQGNVLARMGFRRAAEGSYQQALAREPGRASTQLALAEVRLQLGMAASARDLLEPRVRSSECCAFTWVLYGRALSALGQHRQALEAFERGFQSGAPATAETLLFAAGSCLDESTRKDPRARLVARPWLHRAIDLEPQSTLAHHYLGLLAEEDGQLDVAIDHHRRAVETDPMHLPSLARLADLYQRRGEHGLAAEMARRALDLERSTGRKQTMGALLFEPPRR